ncbi:MAG: response regulator [Deltaproteobacteria bacterium]|jgi:PAS domain S-box-containing protein|nr:response regulator [Deltaproteobacteria bacterium]
MTWFDNLPIRNKLFIVFGMFVCIMAAFAVFSVTQKIDIRDNLDELLYSHQMRQVHVADATAVFARLRLANLAQMLLLAADRFQDRFSALRENYENDIALFSEHVQQYRESILADPGATEAERRQRLATANAILALFAEYMEITAAFAPALAMKDQEAILRVYERSIPLSLRLQGQLERLRDEALSSAKEKTAGAMSHMTRAINIVAALIFGCLLLCFGALLFAVRNIERPIARLERAVTAIAHGNLTYPIRSERRDEVGSLANSIGIMVDEISEHNKIAAIMDSLDSMVCVADFEYNLLFVNKRLADIFGLDRTSCVGKKCHKVLRNQDHPCSCCCMAELLPLRDAEPSVDIEAWDDVLHMWMGGTAALIRWVDGSQVLFQSVKDVTQKKRQAVLLQQALQEAKTASSAKSAFLAAMSHEIRTPMNAILGITEILLAGVSLSQEIAEGLDKIHTSADLLLGIINDILDLSKIEAGKLELMPERYEVASLINDTVHLNLMRLESKPIEFRLDVDEALPAYLFGDALRLKQILNNLLSNAFKYTDSGEIALSIHVEAQNGQDAAPAARVSCPEGGGEQSPSAMSPEAPDVTLVLRVRDTGRGMTEAQLGKLFDEYTRFAEDANRTVGGTGLGMPITRNLVHMMNGEIFVESVPDKGSVFTVRLPQGNVGAGALGKEVVENLRLFRLDQGSQLKKSHILHEPMPYGSVLIVDDVETNLYVAKGLMRRYLLRIDTALSGFEAIEKIRDGNVYDIVFMDHMMPQMDGMEATKTIRDLGYTRPIVALTANVVAGQAEVFLANGFDYVLAKPIDLRQLNATLNKLVRDKQPLEALEAARREHGFFHNKTDGNAGTQRIDPQLAASFARDAGKAIAALEEVGDNGQSGGDERLAMYTLEAHAMKGALANIGEAVLAEKARRLEQAGRSRDFAVIAAETPDFLDALRAVLEKVVPKDEDEDAPGGIADEDLAYLREKLLALRAACAAYDIGVAESALAELRQKTWSRQTRDLLGVIAEHLLHSDLDEASSAAENHANGLPGAAAL